MLYYIGCPIPRGSDCDDKCKCLKGEYCRHLEICFSENDLDLLYFRYKGDKSEFFQSKEQAYQYLLHIQKN